ncbi:unnamed protein product [Soboliphyme baturini]|uniref:GRIP domain-containing protein n=1 Tax=Soboliphyme baturini TaxID=241478 RepID=A0A183J9W7_9BILA|nr:unnamed protein product [Soboliphyme baturini]
MVSELQTKLVRIQEEKRRAETHFTQLIEEFERTLNELKSYHSETIKKKEEECVRKIFDLENELQKQRERTLDIILEKDKELELMREILRARSRSSVNSSTSNGYAGQESPNIAFNLTPRSSSPFTGDRGGSSLIAQYETVINDAEVSRLRAELREVKDQLCEFKRSSMMLNLEKSEKVEAQKQEIMNLRIRLARSRHDTNLEYLKNVLLRFVSSESSTDRQHMVKALAALLKLSQSEVCRLQKCSFRQK